VGRDRAEELLAVSGAVLADVRRAGEPGRPGGRVGEVDVAVLRAEEAGPAADVRVADEDVRRYVGAGRAALVGDDRPDRRVGDRAADRPPGVDEVRGEGVLVDDLVVDRPDGGDPIHQSGHLRQVLAHPHAAHGGVDRAVERPGLLRRALVRADGLRVERVDLPHPAAEPDEDAVLGLALRQRGGFGGERREGDRGGGGEEVAAVHGGSCTRSWRASSRKADVA
jgi:hypothetical protein